jgi:hypothetical protein
MSTLGSISTRYIDQLRRAAEVTDSPEHREWFTTVADDLEARRPVRNLDEVMRFVKENQEGSTPS